METIKQEPGSKDCLACVAAMATGTIVEQFKKFIKDKNLPFDCDFTFLQYLWENGYMTGSYFSTNCVTSDLRMNNLSNVDLLKGNLYVVVESNNDWVKEQGASHAIYWDGDNQELHDPAPNMNKNKLKDYKVIMCMAIIKNAEHQRWKNKADTDSG